VLLKAFFAEIDDTGARITLAAELFGAITAASELPGFISAEEDELSGFISAEEDELSGFISAEENELSGYSGEATEKFSESFPDTIPISSSLEVTSVGTVEV
jgi:hypothetical protein